MSVKTTLKYTMLFIISAFLFSITADAWDGDQIDAGTRASMILKSMAGRQALILIKSSRFTSAM